jgi:membrane protease YdiL (CAAX protease family)
LGEEPGWRGYLQPSLQSQHGAKKSIWILGAIWSIWHYPFLIYYTISGMGEVPTIQVVITLVLSLVGNFLTLVGITYIYTWVYNNTQSIFIAIILHALSNFVPVILLGESSQALSIFSALMPWVVVWVLERMYGKDSFPGQMKA